MRKIEVLIVISITILFVFLNSLPFIAGVLTTPAGSVFLGTVHWPGDYFSYLSQFAQGRESWFASYNLYTNDYPYPTLVGWVNVFLGHIFSLVEIDHLAAYQLSIVIFTISFLLVSYLMIRELFRDPVGDMGEVREMGGKRLTAFILFVTANAFPRILWEGGRLSFSYFDFWFNNGIPFNRLGGVPHHLVARTLIVLVLLLALKWWRNIYYFKRTYVAFNILFFLILGFIFSSVEPVHWILVVTVLLLVGLINFLKLPGGDFLVSLTSGNREETSRLQSSATPHLYHSARETRKSPMAIINQLIVIFPSLFLFLGGLPMAVYLKRLFASPPYSQLANWETTQQLSVSGLDFILGNGPVMVLAMVGMMIVIFRNLRWEVGGEKVDKEMGSGKGKNLTSHFSNPSSHFSLLMSDLLLLIFPIITIGLFFSPLPRLVSIVNVRFLPAVTTLFLAILATEGIYFLQTRFVRSDKPGLYSYSWVFLIITLLILLPTYSVQIQNRIKTDPVNSFFYIPQKAFETYKEAEKLGNIKDTFMVIWPFNWSFPGITGRRVYEGHSLATIDYQRKELLTRSFFFGDMGKVEMEKMMISERIDYVVTYPWTRNINELSNIEKIFDNGSLGIYRVKK